MYRAVNEPFDLFMNRKLILKNVCLCSLVANNLRSSPNFKFDY